jgi:hypothetical protein
VAAVGRRSRDTGTVMSGGRSDDGVGVGRSSRLTQPLAVALLVLGSSVASCAFGAGGVAPQVAGATPVKAEYFTSEYGVRMGVRVEFPEDRRVTSARLVWEGGADDVALYPVDGTDPEPAPKTIDLPQGVQVLLEGNVMAACPEVPSTPVFEVQTVRAGTQTTERYLPDDPAKFEAAFKQWCELPFAVTLTGSTYTPEGDCTYVLSLHNPGPDVVKVVAEEATGADWVWEASEVEVPAGTIGSLTIRGHGEPPAAPWDSGLLLANGQPIAPGGGSATATATSPDDLC